MEIERDVRKRMREHHKRMTDKREQRVHGRSRNTHWQQENKHATTLHQRVATELQTVANEMEWQANPYHPLHAAVPLAGSTASNGAPAHDPRGYEPPRQAQTRAQAAMLVLFMLAVIDTSTR